MFNFLSYQGNASQNNFEIPSYTCQTKIKQWKKKAYSANGTGITGFNMQKNENRSISTAMHQTQVQMD